MTEIRSCEDMKGRVHASPYTAELPAPGPSGRSVPPMRRGLSRPLLGQAPALSCRVRQRMIPLWAIRSRQTVRLIVVYDLKQASYD